MIFIKLRGKNKIFLKKYRNFFFLLMISFLYVLLIIIQKTKYNVDRKKEDEINITREKIYNSNNQCYLSPYISNITIIHLIITRFLMNFYNKNGFPKKIENDDYIQNGIRVMKKYLLPSLENQSCKNFTWILMLGNGANMTYIKSLLTLNYSFDIRLLYQRDLKNVIRNITKGFQVLITTRIDYDDRIYYDAVNDIRKSINIWI